MLTSTVGWDLWRAWCRGSQTPSVSSLITRTGMSSSVPAVMISFWIGVVSIWSRPSFPLLYREHGARLSQALLRTLLHSHSQIQVRDCDILLSVKQLHYLRLNLVYFKVWVIRMHKLEFFSGIFWLKVKQKLSTTNSIVQMKTF